MMQLEFDERVQQNRKIIKGASARDWHESGKVYENHPNQLQLLLMRNLLVISNSIPVSANSDWKMNIDDATVARLGASMLKSMGLVNRLILLNPATMTPLQMDQSLEIYRVYCTLESTLDPGHELGGELSMMDSLVSIPSNASNGIEMPSSIIKLIQFMKNNSALIHFHKKLTNRQNTTEELKYSVKKALTAIKMEQNMAVVLLKERLSKLEVELHALDSELSLVKEKIKRVIVLGKDMGKYDVAVIEALKYITAEKMQLDMILDRIVPDVCIAAAIMVRAGWLPDQIRQECLDLMRSEVSQNNQLPSDGPFILGSILDRLQVRFWVNHSKENLTRDAPTLNSMSLVSLSPTYTYIIDPEGMSQNALMSVWSNIYSCYQVPASQFSMDLFSQWTNRSETKDEVLVVIITDVQTGVSDDLITFLTADIDLLAKAKAAHADAYDTSVLIDQETTLFAELNPIFKTSSAQKRLVAIGQLKLILISTEPPTLDSSGIGRPLPTSCFKNMITIHWATSFATSNFYVESKPLLNTTNRSHAACRLLDATFFRLLCDEVSPDHFLKLSSLNSRVSENTVELYAAETGNLNMVAKWFSQTLENEPQSCDVYTESNYLTQPKIVLGVLSDESCCQSLLAAVSKRSLSTNILRNSKQLERESLGYQKVLGEISGMTSDFFRMCTMLIPTNILPPYALNVITLSEKLFRRFFADKETKMYLKRIPSSIRHLHRFVRAICTIQSSFSKKT
jgi:hypothetical protein